MCEVSLGNYIGVCVPANLKGKEREDYIVKAVVDGSRVTVSQSSVDERAKSMVEEYALRLNQQGLSIESYYESAKTSEAELLDKMRGYSRKHLEGRAVLEAVADAENIVATEDEYDKQIERLGKMYLVSKNEVKKIMNGKEEKRLKTDIKVQKALNFIVENAKEL
jgi:trigger factor